MQETGSLPDHELEKIKYVRRGCEGSTQKTLRQVVTLQKEPALAETKTGVFKEGAG